MGSSKEKDRKRSPTNKNELIRFIKEEWEKIPSEYNIPKLIQSMRRRLQAIIDAQGGIINLKKLHARVAFYIREQKQILIIENRFIVF